MASYFVIPGQIRKNSILVDFDDNGYLLQLFTKVIMHFPARFAILITSQYICIAAS